ncbi:hypothetical protein AKJ52_00855 [candidate division MSBL1 archaeon SCGC-AAA382C18]|uniref:Uncharacterized protein n=1 Tax=candidate division MSBL1 archaeon SCGC-AAA382C18 TaxID=1698281 RepID=A0A133VL18_9EURY|nr:hypothetical protein AKJ52_00855 [candidate division MSBL1 archaeon SCGC-AAA382C18]
MEIMEYLINGLCDSAGKTTAMVGLFQNFDKDMDVNLFKPFAANDYWHDHSVIVDSLEKGVLFGHDAKVLSNFTEQREVEINPIHRVWAPESVVGQGIGVGGSGSTMILDRVFDGNDTTFVINSEIALPKKFETLLDSADRVIEISTVEELNNLSEDLYVSTVEQRYKKISKTDKLMVESYSDIAMPLNFSPDVVISIEPGKVHISDGQKYKNAYTMHRERWKDYSRELKTRKILNMTQPTTIKIQPSPLNDISEAGEVYSKVYQKMKELYTD